MPTTRSSNRPAPKRAVTPESDDDEDYVRKPAGRGGRRGENKRGGGRGGTRGRPRKDPSAVGKPPAKRGRKKANKSESEEEDNLIEYDHLHDELKKCLSLWQEFAKSEHEPYTFPFRYPVDAVALKLTDYHEIIKNPMDMVTIKKKLLGEEYDTAAEFKEDFKLMISNCLLYNNRGDPVSDLAIQFRNAFASRWRKEFPEDSGDFGEAEDDEVTDSEEESDEEQEKKIVDDKQTREGEESTKFAQSNQGDTLASTSSEAQAAQVHDETAESNTSSINKHDSELNSSTTAADSTTEEIHS